MNFWDSSAILPLLVCESTHGRMVEMLEQDPQVMYWWGSQVEIASAVARCERDQGMSADEAGQTLVTANDLFSGWHELAPSDIVRRTAIRLLRLHPLRAADSLQLAAALVAVDHEPSRLGFVCLDKRLANAAQREGFSVLS